MCMVLYDDACPFKTSEETPLRKNADGMPPSPVIAIQRVKGGGTFRPRKGTEGERICRYLVILSVEKLSP